MKVSIVLCMYNEIRSIEKAFLNLDKQCIEKSISYEIILVDNNSNDGTKEWVAACDADNVIKIFNEKNLGKGGSIKRAIRVASGKYFVIYDPDQEYEPAAIWDSIEKMEVTNAECVLASRTLGGRKEYKYLVNYYGVMFLTALINILYGTKLTDSATAVKCFNLNFLKRIKLVSNGFNLDFELVCRVAKMGGLIEEVQANYFPRSKSEGKKLKVFKDGILSLAVIIRLRFIN
jgi:dolichol-phosphate mannosyltransferase